MVLAPRCRDLESWCYATEPSWVWLGTVAIPIGVVKWHQVGGNAPTSEPPSLTSTKFPSSDEAAKGTRSGATVSPSGGEQETARALSCTETESLKPGGNFAVTALRRKKNFAYPEPRRESLSILDEYQFQRDPR